MTTIRFPRAVPYILIAVLMMFVSAVAIAGGQRESAPPASDPAAGESEAESRSGGEGDAGNRAGGETEGSAGNAGEDGSQPAVDGAATNPNDAESADDESASSLPAMDDATAASLTRMGMMPFKEKIPSEDFQLAVLGGGESSLAEHEGKLVFLNFWATWCPPCREEMPAMQTLYDELREEGLEMLAVNVLEDEQTAAGFIDEHGFTYPVLMDRDGRVMLRYGVRAYPTTYIIDREGYVIGVRPGYHDWSTETVIAEMRNLLATDE